MPDYQTFSLFSATHVCPECFCKNMGVKGEMCEKAGWVRTKIRTHPAETGNNTKKYLRNVKANPQGKMTRTRTDTHEARNVHL